ncbi:bifunctional cytidylyltransferase/SDR family oxidoreductase [Leucobacter massiliensis]|uniref:2-C-methyl-D-erythritol 4-phosphate cytidylyltransferase n=1 Tax=Leucobacter massiliensis TaxID=1686285 RepID=A0A2S9QL55_9MICO|nr:bifunctional cytidylyltransferase/SDR family oxidoreductase [Leucobacter massiliensis]PRI10326.1 2-C-methyl-D-erythritol 4-phosphate cytidylyltransferase [Leucobacter massiliensis]
MTSDKTIMVLLAGGVGARVGMGIPKQLLKIAGKPIIEHTLEACEASPLIDEILIMMNPGTIAELDYLKDRPGSKLSRILPGGATRNETTRLALAEIEGNPKVLFHDAVRPFVDARIIADCVDALDEYDAVDTATPSADTIIQVDDSDCITGIPRRSLLRRGQTPQGFRAEVLRRAYEIASGDPDFSATDDCGVVFSYLPEVPIKVVAGSGANMKVTEQIDLHIADKIFQLQSASADQLDHELGALEGSVVIVFGASYGIGESIVTLARAAGARVHAFSRSETGTDVTDQVAVQAALERVLRREKRIDHVIVTAGVLRISDLVEAPDEDIRKTVDTNLIAPALIAQMSFDALSQSKGSLTFFTSSSYTRGRAGYSMYSATKAGVVNLTQALAEEWASAGVRVNAINPQRTATPMRTQAFGEEPEGSLLTAEEVAEATLRTICSPATGQTINVRL